MTRIKKRSGELQEFDRMKLIDSMIRAGANKTVAEQIAERVRVSEGTSTIELRRMVAEELRKVNEAVAEAYVRTLRLRVSANGDIRTGAARIPKRIERLPDVKSGQPARVRHGEKRTEVRVEPALENRELWLNPEDLEALGAPEGTRVAVRFLREGGQPSSAPSPTRTPSAPRPHA
jgi:hypothetical protein